MKPSTVAVAVAAILVGSQAQGQTMDVSFCGFTVGKLYRNAYLNFRLEYTFTVGNNGRPTEIRAIEGRYVDETEVHACLGQWRLPSTAAGTAWRARFTWKHGIGWTQLDVFGPDTHLAIRQTGDHCAERVSTEKGPSSETQVGTGGGDP